MIRFQFVEDHRETYTVKRMCAVLNIHRSSYYKWRATGQARTARARVDQALLERIEYHFDYWEGVYGYRRITAELADDPQVSGPVNHKRVARLMRQAGLVGFNLRKAHQTTVRDPQGRMCDDLVGRDFTARAPHQVYVGDITYLPYGQGKFLYLATVIDVCSRMIVGWSITDHMRAWLVCEALANACRVRGSMEGVVFHSDHGSQYTSKEFRDLCQEYKVRQSMGAIGSSADNAMAESFNASLKRETLRKVKRWESAGDCRQSVFRWIVRYNTKRRHSGLGYLSPASYETNHAAIMKIAA